MLKFLRVPLFIALIFLAACQKYDNLTLRRESRVIVSLVFSVPSDSNQAAPDQTKASVDENYVHSMHVLLFDENGEFVEVREGENISNTHLTKKQFEVSLPQGTFDIHIVANYDQFSGLTPGMTVDQVSRALSLTNPNAWTLNPFTHIPMWGKVENVTIDANTTEISDDPIYMMRSIASMDVSLSTQLASTNTYMIESIRVYNHSKKGWVVPDQSKLSTALVGGKQVPYIWDPTIYENDIKVAAPPQIYQPDNHWQCLDKIYLFETPEVSPSSLDVSNFCLVIGIANNFDYRELSYHRLDLTEAGSQCISRNHKYKLTIKEIPSGGLETPEEAYHSYRANMPPLEIMDWYMLEVDDNELGKTYEFNVPTRRTGSTWGYVTRLPISFSSDHPDGWTAVLSSSPTNPWATGPNWAWIDGSDSGGPGDNTVWIYCDAPPSTEVGKFNYLHITSGIVTIVVVIEVYNREE